MHLGYATASLNFESIFSSYIFQQQTIKEPVTVAERSKACTVFAFSEAAIVGSNPPHGRDV
jgi:hypothetical protein